MWFKILSNMTSKLMKLSQLIYRNFFKAQKKLIIFRNKSIVGFSIFDETLPVGIFFQN